MIGQPDGKTALILSGGGSYGAYEVGIMRALLTGQARVTNFRPLCPDIITGTSAGALNAAILLSSFGRDAAAAINYLESIYLDEIADTSERCGSGVLRFRPNPLTFFDPACYAPNPAAPFVQFARDTVQLAGHYFGRTVEFIRATGDWEQRTLEFADLSAFINTEPFTGLVRRHVNTGNIRRWGRTLQIATTNWRTGLGRLFTAADCDNDVLIRAVHASASIPGIFPPVEIGGEFYADGGLVMNAALSPAIRAGASDVHLVYVDPIVQEVPLPRTPSTAHSIYRALVIGLAAMLNRDLEYARRINRALNIIEERESINGTAATDPVLVLLLANLIGRQGSKVSYRKINVHRYCLRLPERSLLQWLSFGVDHVRDLIARGYRDAIQHDCARENCILAAGPPPYDKAGPRRGVAAEP